MEMMDKSWMKLENRLSSEYRNGVKEFLEFAFMHSIEEKIFCPCYKCRNTEIRSKKSVEEHLVIYGIDSSYTEWNLHGEISKSREVLVENVIEDDEIDKLVYDGCGIPYGEDVNGANDEVPRESSKFQRLIREASQSLYPGCESFSTLSFTVRLWHLKCLHGLSNKAFTDMLQLHKESLLHGETLPNSFYEAKKLIRDLGLHYEKIDACVNDCMLYWKENTNNDSCIACGVSRWKSSCKSLVDCPSTSNKSSKKVPIKTLRYFPLIPRLQRLFMSSKTSDEMRWNNEKRTKDGILRHPADFKAWEALNRIDPSFAVESRNVRLGLASDGFNPFGNMSNVHSTWPVLLVPYNLPPWLCMKQPFIILSMIIPGPKAPGNDIDVYLQPLVEELKVLWESGVEMYDASMKSNFILRAALLWTINDFPAYGNLSGWSTKGTFACPYCNKDTSSQYLIHSKKTVYMGHRRFLPLKHKWRKSKKPFNGKTEVRSPPKLLDRNEILDQLQGFCNIYGKKLGKNKRCSNYFNWRKKSIFFELPYWKDLLLRHNLDVMHIEKNICDSLIGTLFNIEGKTKDHLKGRLDLKEMRIRGDLHPYLVGERWFFNAAPYTLSNEEKLAMCTFLKNVKMPDGYASNISRCVNIQERKISGLKSHDFHVLLVRLLPLAVRGKMDKQLRNAIIELCVFFRELSSKTLKEEELGRLENSIIVTLCKLEMFFPPSFFDVMIHLSIHLAFEAKIGGPVQYRWMYPIERYLSTLKSFVRNKSRPEASIAEAYIADECINFCSRYLKGVETKQTRPPRINDRVPSVQTATLSVFAKHGIPYQNVGLRCELDRIDITQAQLYILRNCLEVAPFISEYEAMDGQIAADEKFVCWFQQRVSKLHSNGSNDVSQELYYLACGPDLVATIYEGYKINGFRFSINKSDIQCVTQNSGVYVRGITGSTDVNYYGVLTDIIELHYMRENSITLFKCVWWDVYSQGKGIQKDIYGFISINTKQELNTDEPYILASQAEQVFYIQDCSRTNWVVVEKAQPRDIFNMCEGEAETLVDDTLAYQQQNPSMQPLIIIEPSYGGEDMDCENELGNEDEDKETCSK